MTPDQSVLSQFAAAVETRRECDPTYRLEEYIASLRDTDPERWQQLQREWNAS